MSGLDSWDNPIDYAAGYRALGFKGKEAEPEKVSVWRKMSDIILFWL